jgi:hypothetical protein
VSSVTSALWAIVDFLQTYNGAVTAIATVIIAAFTVILGLFTVSLANATRKAAEAADLSARTGAGVELPWLIVDQIHAQPFYNDIIATLTSNDVWLAFQNLGRSDAVIVAECFVHHVGDALTSHPHYPPGAIRSKSFGESVGHRLKYETSFGLALPRKQAATIASGETILWLYGYLEYLDFLGHTYRSGFSAALKPVVIDGNPVSLPFRSEGPTAYTYKQQIN